MNEQQILQAIVTRMRAEFDVNRIVLFGSRARGEARVDSDYDILVEVNSDQGFWERQRSALKAFGPRDWSMDLLVMTPAELARNCATLGSTAYWAAQEGRTLYERSNN